MSGLRVSGCSDVCFNAMKDSKWRSKSVHDMSSRYLNSTMCVIASVVILSELVVDGVAGAVLVGVAEADSRTTAMFGNMRVADEMGCDYSHAR